MKPIIRTVSLYEINIENCISLWNWWWEQYHFMELIIRTVPLYQSNNDNSSCSRSSRTDRCGHFLQNAGLRLFLHTWIVHSINDCYQLIGTFGGFSAQCFCKLFLKKFTVLLVTTSFDRAFWVVVILIG